MKDDASNVERNTASVDTLVCGLARKLVNRRTLIIAFQILFWIVKIARLLSRLMGNS